MSDQIDNTAREEQAKIQAYRRTFLSTREGQVVLADILDALRWGHVEVEATAETTILRREADRILRNLGFLNGGDFYERVINALQIVTAHTEENDA